MSAQLAGHGGDLPADDLQVSALPTEVPTELIAMLEAMATVVPPHSATYLSTPITTGELLLDAVREKRMKDPSTTPASLPSRVLDEVMAANRAHAASVAARLRESDPLVINPSQLASPDWDQPTFHAWWLHVLRQFVRQLVVVDGWQYSTGCGLELGLATRLAIPVLTEHGSPLSPSAAMRLLTAAVGQLRAAGFPTFAQEEAIRALRNVHPETTLKPPTHDSRTLKDETLARLSTRGNIAQFISFGPSTLLQRFIRLRGTSVDHRFGRPEEGIEALLNRSSSGKVNVRSFSPDEPGGHPFTYGLARADDVLSVLRTRAAEGLYTIVNETIDVHDGGVSGVAYGDIIEVSPDDTPRCVERPGTFSASYSIVMPVLAALYGGPPELAGATSADRVEFSLHPSPAGLRGTHTILWEWARLGPAALHSRPEWPNNLSRMIGDKTFGLLVASVLGFDTPFTTVITRRVPPFSFGRRTQSGQKWMRTAPATQDPGRYATTPFWIDPFALLQESDPNQHVAAVLAQDGVNSRYSGAAHVINAATINIEGVQGLGDTFMQGECPPEPLPAEISDSVGAFAAQLARKLEPPLRFEWAHDGTNVWLLQLHVNKLHTPPPETEAERIRWLQFDPTEGLDALRALISAANLETDGIHVTKPVGMTSHVGDLLRTAGLPARFRPVSP